MIIQDVAVDRQCVSGSSHGGRGCISNAFKAGLPYDKYNMTSLLGGSGGEIAIVFYLFV